MPNIENQRQIIEEAERRRANRSRRGVGGRINLADTVAAGTLNSPHMRLARVAGATGARAIGPRRRA